MIYIGGPYKCIWRSESIITYNFILIHIVPNTRKKISDDVCEIRDYALI